MFDFIFPALEPLPRDDNPSERGGNGDANRNLTTGLGVGKLGNILFEMVRALSRETSTGDQAINT